MLRFTPRAVNGSSTIPSVRVNSPPVTSSNYGRIVGKECDDGSDVLLTDLVQYPHALTELGWKAAHPRRRLAGRTALTRRCVVSEPRVTAVLR